MMPEQENLPCPGSFFAYASVKPEMSESIAME